MNIIEILSSVSDIFDRTINFFQKEKRKKLKETYSYQKAISKRSKHLKDDVYKTIESFKEDIIDSAPYYVQVLNYLREITHAMHFIVKPTVDHLKNNHKPFVEVQFQELNTMSKKLMKLCNIIIDAVKTVHSGGALINPEVAKIILNQFTHLASATADVALENDLTDREVEIQN